MLFQIAVVSLLPAVLMVTHAIDRPANLGRPDDERPSNLTIDQIIQNQMDPDAPESLIGPDGLILTELDILLTQDQYNEMYPQEGDRSKRRATRDMKKRWTNATLNYMYYPGHFSLYQQYWLRRAFTDWERYTCINFKPKAKEDVNWARFQNGVGCNSQLGMVGGMQPINLEAPGCRWKGLYLHETGHAIGLIHEQQSPLRDDWIWIEMENVKPEWREWFKKRTVEEVNTYGVPYEYSSIMHYGITAFSKDGKSQTIHAKYPEREKEIGIVYLKELAWTDAAIVNKMYHCAAHCPDQDKCGSDGVLNENCQCICKDGSHDTCDRTLTADPTCKNDDNSWKCYIWANQGECERNPRYMKKACKKACQVCGMPKASPPSPCKNMYLDKKCDMWQKRGDCVTNRWWMQQNCARSCKLCTEQDRKAQESCQNQYTDLAKCNDWATSGECAINPDGMFKNCQMSCKACDKTGGHVGFGQTEIAPLVTRKNDFKCDNKHAKCVEWAGWKDECDNNAKYMIYNCRKACGKCEDDTCKNIYSDKWCKFWAEKGECKANPAFMVRNCAQSCGTGHCEGKVTKAPPKVTNAPTKVDTTKAPCENTHGNDHDCDVWAQAGHCNTNPGFMKVRCALSCGECTVHESTHRPPKACVDDKAECPMWAMQGHCDTDRAVTVLKQCRKSCNNCACPNESRFCDGWAERGGCTSHPDYMLRHCQTSCKLC